MNDIEVALAVLKKLNMSKYEMIKTTYNVVNTIGESYLKDTLLKYPDIVNETEKFLDHIKDYPNAEYCLVLNALEAVASALDIVLKDLESNEK